MRGPAGTTCCRVLPADSPARHPPAPHAQGLFFFLFHPQKPEPEPLQHKCCLLTAAARCSASFPWRPMSFLVKELIQVSSDSIFPPLLDKQNREMPLTRKRSSNHLVFASRSLPVTVETTPLPPTCCQCLDCSYSLLIKLASPLLFCYPIQSHYVLQTPCRSD